MASTDRILSLVEKALPFVLMVLEILRDDDIADAILRSDELTDEQRARITSLRHNAINEWELLKPKEE